MTGNHIHHTISVTYHPYSLYLLSNGIAHYPLVHLQHRHHSLNFNITCLPTYTLYTLYLFTIYLSIYLSITYLSSIYLLLSHHAHLHATAMSCYRSAVLLRISTPGHTASATYWSLILDPSSTVSFFGYTLVFGLFFHFSLFSFPPFPPPIPYALLASLSLFFSFARSLSILVVSRTSPACFPCILVDFLVFFPALRARRYTPASGVVGGAQPTKGQLAPPTYTNTPYCFYPHMRRENLTFICNYAFLNTTRHKLPYNVVGTVLAALYQKLFHIYFPSFNASYFNKYTW